MAFVESVVTRAVAAGPKLPSFDPLLDDVPDLRKPFTSVLGLSIAPLKCPHFEGTAAKDDKRTAILTCAHVARPTLPSRRSSRRCALQSVRVEP